MDVKFTERELDLMQALWARGPSTVAEVRDALEDDLAYNTVLTLLRILEEKGHVTRDTSQRAHRYTPAVERADARRLAVQRMADRLFQGSPEELMVQLVEAQELAPEELRRLREILDRRLAVLEGAAPEEDG